MSKPVLFSCFRPIERAENLRAIYEAYTGPKKLIHSYDPDYKAEVTSGKYDVMVIDDFPAYKISKCISIGHGIQGGKLVGLSQPGNPYYDKSVADRVTYLISAGHGTIEMSERSFCIPHEKILPLGIPRTDQYIGKKKGDGHTILADKRAYLYVPTFRDKGETPFPDIDWDYIDGQLSSGEFLAIKPHPWYYQYISKIITDKKYRHIIGISGDEPSAPYLYDADVVITDYSSIMFDAYLLDKPVVLFEKKQGYLQTRGLYMDYRSQYSSRYATNEQDLIDLLRNSYSLRATEKECLRIVADMCDGHSCERICNLIDKLNGGEQ